MLRKFFLEFLSIMAVATLSIIGLSASRNSVRIASAQNGETQGSLQVVDPNGKPKAVCPLKHTDVKAEISGFLARAVVTQEFENPFKEKIEAIYTFPLPQNAAVDDMTMLVGDRTVRGKILRREEAQAVYDASGSMSGFPIEKAKETMKLALDNLYPYDTFNLITFSGDEHILFPEPVPATKENLVKAQAFLESRQGGGGTEMMKAIKASMDPSDASYRRRKRGGCFEIAFAGRTKTRAVTKQISSDGSRSNRPSERMAN